MVDEVKKGFDWYTIIIWVGLIILIGSIAYRTYEERGWSKDFTCTVWQPYDNQSATDGDHCVLDNCIRLETNLNTDVDKCICILNNKTVTRKCVERLQVWRLNK